MSKRYSLSLKKLAGALEKKLYTLVSVYCSPDNEVLFLEIRSPKMQKTFIVHVQEKYKMTCDTDNFRIVLISPGNMDLRQHEYILEVKGPLLTCDLISISSSTICLCKNNGASKGYIFGTKAMEEESETDSDDQDSIEDILGTAKELAEKMDEKISEDEDEEVVEEHDSNVEEIVELVFEDANGNEFDGKVAEIMEKDIIIPPAAPVKKKTPKKEKIESVVSEQKEIRKDNSVPHGIEDEDGEIILGIIYYCIDISSFYKKLDSVTFEKEILTTYDTLDDNEDEMRTIKVDEIIEFAAKLTLKVKEEVSEYKKTEMKLKTQVLKLSSVLENSEKLRTKANSSPDKYLDSKPEIERLYKQTKTALHEINIQMSLNKDRINELLEQYQTGIEELLEL